MAAQTSRDRKKAKMDDMEDRMSRLEETNAKLVSEMKSLKELNERLMSENSQLRKQVAAAPARSVVSANSSGSAESRPLPKEEFAQTAVRAESMTALYQLLTLILLSKTSSPKSIPTSISIASNSWPTSYLEKLTQTLKEQIST